MKKKKFSITKILVVFSILLLCILSFILLETSKIRENAFRVEATKAISAADAAINIFNNESYVFSEEKTSCNNNQLFCFTIEDLIKIGLYDGDEKQYSGKVEVNAIDPLNVRYNLYFKKGNEFKIIRGPHNSYVDKGVLSPEPWKEEYSICTCIEN